MFDRILRNRELDAVDDRGTRRDGELVRELRQQADILVRGGRGERRVSAGPIGGRGSDDDAVDAVLDVLGFQAGEHALLLRDLHVEQGQVHLIDQRLDHRGPLHAGRTRGSGVDVARVGEGAGADRGLFEVAMRVAGCRALIDALAQDRLATHEVDDLGLVHVDLDRAGADEVGSSLDLLDDRIIRAGEVCASGTARGSVQHGCFPLEFGGRPAAFGGEGERRRLRLRRARSGRLRRPAASAA